MGEQLKYEESKYEEPEFEEPKFEREHVLASPFGCRCA